MAIPENIEQLANDVRTKVYGREVREALASGIEAAGSIANDADVRSQETETKQTSLEKKYDEQIANMSLENPNVAEVVDARVSGYNGQSYTTIGKRFDSVDAQLAENLNVSPSVISAFWDSPEVPSIRPEANSWADVTWKYQTMIDNLWEPLRLQDTNYIKRVDKGLASDGVNHWYRYEFTPPNYEKTMILLAGIHGAERVGIYTLYRFMYHVVNDWKQYSQLSYLRHKVRLIVIPSANPYAQDKLIRYNANGVDLNRNFDYRWSQSTDPYKGSAPFSEVESQYIKDTLEQYSDATTYLDLHNFGVGDSTFDFIVYTPKLETFPREVYRKVIQRYSTNSTSLKWDQTDNPSAFNYAANRFGMIASNPEFQPGKYGDSHGSEDMTNALRWFGNIILQHARFEGNAKVETAVEPFTIRTIFNRSGSTDIVIPVTDVYSEIEDFQLSFNVPTSGIVTLHGEVVIFGTLNPTTQTFFVPKLGQTGTKFLPDTVQNTYWEVYTEGGERQTIPFSAEIPVVPSDNGNPVVMGMYAKRTTDLENNPGEIKIYRYRATATFIPADKSERLQMFTATNRQGSGVGAMQRFYPI